jgi:hypothetical protein
MAASRYTFDTIFTYDSTNGVLVPKYAIALNGARFTKGVPIPKDPNSSGLVLFNYIGRDIIGIYDETNGVLQIEGFG